MTDNITKVLGKHTIKAGFVYYAQPLLEGESGQRFLRQFRVRQGCEQSTRLPITDIPMPYSATSILTRRAQPGPAPISAPARSKSTSRIPGRSTDDSLSSTAFALLHGFPGISALTSNPAFDPKACDPKQAHPALYAWPQRCRSARRGQSCNRRATARGLHRRDCSRRRQRS